MHPSSLERCILLFALLIGLLSVNGNTLPKHVHLSLSALPNQMNVVWYTEEEVTDATVQYGTSENDLEDQYEVLAVSRKLTYGEGFIHRATMHTLDFDTVYYYRVGRPGKSGTWSKNFHFKTRIADNRISASQKVKLLAYGDMGVFPNSLESVAGIARAEVLNDHTDIVLHVGDLAYAFGNFTKWDMWFNATQSISAHVPYMISIGNRDEPIVIQERFTMPSDRSEANAILKPATRQNMYYSFDYNWVHVVSLSINDTYTPDSDQYKWIEFDLKEAAARVQDPQDPLSWIIFIGHTPMYSSSNGHTGGNKLLRDSMEHLLLKYNVTLGVWGDDHVFERSYPVYKNESDTEHITDGNVQKFVSPKKPIHLLVGTAGIDLDGWLKDDEGNEYVPGWSAYRERAHGYVKIEATKTSCEVKFMRKEDGKLADHMIILKSNHSEITIHWLVWAAPLALAIYFFVIRKTNIMSAVQESKKT